MPYRPDWAVQGHVTRLSNLLLMTGQDTDCPAGAQLGQLEQEFCCLHAVKMRVAPREWSRFYQFRSSQDQGVEQQPESLSQTDMSSLLVSPAITAGSIA